VTFKKVKFNMSYEDCLRDAMRLHGVSSPDERCAHLARSVFKMKNRYRKHEEYKKSRSSVLITDAPKQVVEQKYTTNICQSTTLKGKRCTFKATCGNFCKKHSTKETPAVALGRKISFNI
jgi:hypothetical protein